MARDTVCCIRSMAALTSSESRYRCTADLSWSSNELIVYTQQDLRRNGRHDIWTTQRDDRAHLHTVVTHRHWS